MPSGWEDEFEILPDTTEDETSRGWGDDDGSNDRRLVDERPPHWD